MARLPSLNTKKDMNTKYVSVRRATWIIAWATRLGLNTSYWKLYRKNTRTLRICLLISSRIGILKNIVRILIRNLPMPLTLIKRTLRTTLKPMSHISLEVHAVICVMPTNGFCWILICRQRSMAL